MSGPAISEQMRAADGVTRLRLVNGPLLRPVLCRVVSMVLARADWPLDRLGEALLVCDALCAHTPARAEGEELTFSIQADEREAELRLSELEPHDAETLVHARLPLVGNVLERLAKRVAVDREQGGETARLTISLSSG